MEQLRRGAGSYNPLYVEDEITRELIPVYVPQDAVAYGCKPGEKAGNPVADENNERIKQEERILESLFEKLFKDVNNLT